MEKSYAMYLRKSRADVEAEARGEGETLARHRRALTELARRRGLNVVRVYEELVSGDSIDSRPQMQQLLAAVQQGLYAGVIVNDADRLARGDSIDQGVVKQAFYSTNTLIITPLKTYDPTNVADEDYFDFSLFMARFEYKFIKRRLQTGRMRSASEGNYLGSRAVYGYRRVKRSDRSGWTLEPDPDKAAVVQMIFELYAHGDGNGPIGANTIALRLNAMGLSTDLGHPYDGNRIRKMLQNPAYIGEVSWGKRLKHVRIVNGQRVTSRDPNEDPIVVENAHPAIIDRDLWNEVQHLFSTHAKLPKNKDKPLVNLFAGLVRCPLCGHFMLRRPGDAPRPDMICCRTSGCPTTGIYIPILEEAVLDVLRDWTVRYADPEAEPTAEESETQAAPKHAIASQISTLDKQLDALHDLVEQGIYTPADFVRRRDALLARRSDAEAQLHALENTPSISDQIRAELPRVRHVLDAYPMTEDILRKNHLLKSVIDHIDYSKTKKCQRNQNPADFLHITVYPKG